MASDFIRQFQAARRAGAPLIAVRTPDPASTIRAVMELIKQLNSENQPVLVWDLMQGLCGVNKPGQALQNAVMQGGKPEKVSARPSEMLRFCQLMTQLDQGADAIIFMANAHQYWKDAATLQGVWNLRDPYKANGSMLILLTTQGATLPEELAEDVLIIDEPLPNTETLERIVKEVWESSGIKPKLTPQIIEKAVDAGIGLAAFPYEQSVAMSLSETGLDVLGLWDRKRQIIGQTPGLSVWRGGETFDAIGGVEEVKKYMRAITKGKNPPRVIVFIDEIEKAFAGMGTDTSGVKTEMTGTLLSWMQDNKARGVIFIGPPGAAKSVVAKAAGNDAGIPTVYFDLSAMQDSLVGKSGERLRSALKVIEAISQGRAFFIATCNAIQSLPPELRRRFKRGSFFFDLPTNEEREVIWRIYEKREGVAGKRPDDEGWTGAEIEQCCEIASELNLSLLQSASYVVPVSRSAADVIENLRLESSGKYISASYPGVYQYKDPVGTPTKTARSAMRKLRTGELNVTPEMGEA